MSKRLRCPECDEVVVEVGSRRPAACPACGARWTSKDSTRPARSADAPGPRKRNRAREQAARGIPILAWAIPAGVLSFLFVAVVVWALWPARPKPGTGPTPSGVSDDPGGLVDAGEPPPEPVATFPPVPWAVPPGGLPAGPSIADVIDVGYAQPVFPATGVRDHYLTAIRGPDPAKPGGTFVESLMFGRFDPKTGKRVGQPVNLGPEFLSHETAPGRFDIAPDGTLAVMRVRGKTADSASAVVLLPPGSQEPRPLPAAISRAAWFGWSAAGRLLVIKGGKLSAWDMAAGKPVSEVGERLAEPVALSPARNWLVACVGGQYLEVRDAATGEVRGRLGGEGDWKSLDISSDGKRLAGARYKPHPPGVQVNHPYSAELHTWDLATGERSARLKVTTAGRVIWAGPGHLYYDGGVFDIEAGLAIARLTAPGGPNGLTPVLSPDGRQWWSGRAGQAFAAAIPTTPQNGRVAFPKGTPVRLEVSCSEARRVAPARATLTRQLAAVGHPVGDSPWLVKVKAEQYETGRSLLVPAQRQTARVPGVRGEMKLIAPDGTVVATVPVGSEFPERRSRYFVRDYPDPKQFGVFQLEYNFKGADPRQALVDEVWSRFVRFPADAGRLPPVWEVGGKFQPLPLALPLPLPAGVRSSFTQRRGR